MSSGSPSTPAIPMRLAIVTGLWLVAAALMFGWLLPAVASGCGAPALDTRLTWGLDDARSLIEECAPEGLAAYGRQQLGDLFYPVLLALTLVGWTRIALRRLHVRTRYVPLLVIPAILALAGDLAENAAIVTLLTNGDIPGWLGVVGGTGALVKNAAGAVAITITMGLVALSLIRPQRAPGPQRSRTRAGIAS